MPASSAQRASRKVKKIKGTNPQTWRFNLFGWRISRYNHFKGPRQAIIKY